MSDTEVKISLTVEERAALRSINNLEKNIDRFSKNAASGIKRTDVAVASFAANLASQAVLGGIRLVANTVSSLFSSAIGAANQQEDALNRLKNALITTGDFSKQAFNDFQNFASEIQRVTKFGDELVLSQLALAKSFGATNAQAKEIVTAATDLSAAFGISLDQAVRDVSATLNGSIGLLGKRIPELKNLTEEQLRSGEALTLLGEKFKGFAQREVGTFSGATAQLNNALGDLAEEFGFLVTQSPEVRLAIKGITDIITGLTGIVKEARPFIDGFFEGIRIAFGGIGRDQESLAKARSEIEKIDEKIKQLNDTLNQPQESNLITRIFGGIDEKAITSKVENLLSQRQALENQINEIEKENIATREREELLSNRRREQEVARSGKSILNEKKKLAAEERLIEQGQLRAATQFSGAAQALAKSGTREAKKLAIADATVNSYAAGVRAFKDYPYPANFAVLASTVAAGLAQVSRITSAGSFAQGGFIGGSQRTGDRLTANVNSGEVVLNPRQQRNFMNIANEGLQQKDDLNNIANRIDNLIQALVNQPLMVNLDGRELARAVRDQSRSGFNI